MHWLIGESVTHYLYAETEHLNQDELKRLRDKQADTTDPNNPLDGL